MKNYMLLRFNLLLFLLLSSLPLAYAKTEADYVNMTCQGEIEYVLPDKTRVDCLTDEYAIEYDWARKWAESVGQSLYYAKMTNKKPAVVLIMKKSNDEKYIQRLEFLDLGIKVYRLKLYSQEHFKPTHSPKTQ